MAFNSTLLVLVELLDSDLVGDEELLLPLSSSRIVMGHSHAFTMESELALKVAAEQRFKQCKALLLL